MTTFFNTLSSRLLEINIDMTRYHAPVLVRTWCFVMFKQVRISIKHGHRVVL